MLLKYNALIHLTTWIEKIFLTHILSQCYFMFQHLMSSISRKTNLLIPVAYAFKVHTIYVISWSNHDFLMNINYWRSKILFGRHFIEISSWRLDIMFLLQKFTSTNIFGTSKSLKMGFRTWPIGPTVVTKFCIDQFVFWYEPVFKILILWHIHTPCLIRDFIKSKRLEKRTIWHY